MFGRAMSNDCIDAIGEMRVMQDGVREIRARYCKPESNANPRSPNSLGHGEDLLDAVSTALQN